MSWQDRRYDSSANGGGFRAALARIFGDGENPLLWSLPLYRAWGIAVRVHIFYVIFIIAELIRSIAQDAFGFAFLFMGMVMLFVLVLLHEYGHCIACRKVDGEADKIIMWPLGGLAFCMPPHQWRAHLITALGGPAVNVILFPVLGAAVLGVTGSVETVVFNPFAIGAVLPLVTLSDATQPLWLLALWWAYFMNAVLLAFNMLVPMYPMDAGRVLHAILWKRSSYDAAMKITVVVGLVSAGAMAVFGIVFQQYLLFTIALFGGITCWIERQRLAVQGERGFAGYDFSQGYLSMPGEDDEPARPGRAAQRRARQAEKDQAELDRLLAKIARDGMGSLTRRERRFLDRQSARRRGS